MGHEALKPCKAMGDIEKRHPKLRAVQTPLSFVEEDPTGMNVIIPWPLVEKCERRGRPSGRRLFQY